MKKDFTKKTREELLKEIDEKNLSLKDIRFGVAGSKSKNVKEVKNIKKEIARIKTFLNKNG